VCAIAPAPPHQRIVLSVGPSGWHRKPALSEGCGRSQLLTGTTVLLDTTLSKQWRQTFQSCKGSHCDAASHARL